MATVNWTGLGLADATVLTNSNLNTTGNGTGTLIFQALAGGATRITKQETNGNGVEISGTTIGDLARLDTSTIAGGAECMAVDFIYKAPPAPATDHNQLIVARNANATPAFSGYVEHTITTNTLAFRDATRATVTSALTGTPTFSAATGSTPALVTGDYYHVSAAFIRNTSTTPSTSNGRILGRVQSISAPGTWNGGAEYWLDTGYTANVTIDKTNLFRTGKAGTAGTVGTFRFLSLTWRDLATPDTSLTKANAVTNLVQTAAPTITSTGTGAGYPIFAIGTPAVGGGGALSYTITQTGGTTHVPATTAVAGVWTVVQDTGSATTYNVTVTEAGGSSTTATYTVPAATATTAGQFRRRKQVSGALI